MPNTDTERAVGELGRIECAANGAHTITIDRPPVNSPRFTDLSVLNDLLVELESDPALRCLVLSAEGEPGFVPAADTPWVAWQERLEFKEGLSDPGHEAWGTEVGAGVACEARSRWKWSV